MELLPHTCSGDGTALAIASRIARVGTLKRDNPHLQQLNSDTASGWSKRLYSAAGLRMSKVSHAPRVSGAQLAELNGVTEDQVSQLLRSLLFSANLPARRSAAQGAGITTR